MKKIISLIVLYILCVFSFGMNTISVSNIDSMDDEVWLTLDYSFDESVCGIQFDFLTDNIIELIDIPVVVLF